jgi:glycosyltransferase involved in cell wall biosynthesis
MQLIKNDMLKFGIYTTFYNCERFIDKIFTSIESLSYDNFEWHITDDYSTDNTKNLVLERLEKSPLKYKIGYYEQSEKKQMYWKPNEFFDETFDWIILVDADDDFDKNFLNVYNNFLLGKDDVSLVSSDFIKINESDNSRHSISYVINDDIMSNKINRYHPSCDYLNNISYSCFGHLRGFKNIIPSFDVDDMLACAEDSYHIFWSNSFGKYLHIPRPLYTWYLRDDSESHRKIVPANFNDNFKIALDKLNQSDAGVDKMFNDIYIETSTLGSYDFKSLKGKKVSLWTRVLSRGQKETLQSLYYDIELDFNDADSDIHLYSLNYYNESDLENSLRKTKGKKMMFYYQNQNYHENNEQKENELDSQLNKYLNIIDKHTGYSWWKYIRHFIIKN